MCQLLKCRKCVLHSVFAGNQWQTVDPQP